MSTIDILMATYNGQKFIAEQLDSIFSQTFQDFRLIVRDDGSTDNTCAILEEYSAKYPGRIKIIHDEAVCKSATKNFFEILKHAEADYVMFSDQDDVWLKYKVQITLDYMKETERKNPGKPVLIFT
ncbi:MAG: glycosyltransferase, partial [Synergistaceae bacterium]|nr:glycosyltransferase [Synergistaceae bacterium]